MVRFLAAMALFFCANGVQAQETYRAYGNQRSAYSDDKYYTPRPVASQSVLEYNRMPAGGGYSHSYRVNYEYSVPSYGSGSSSSRFGR
jgi:hypothetical protein